MAFIRADIKLPKAGRTINTHLYFPTDLPDDVGNKVKGVITLLHGIHGAGVDWMMYTAAVRYAADNGYVLVAPSAGNSFYHNEAYGAPFYDIITEELPAQLQAIFKIPTERDKNYIAGLSMGGYGALYIGLQHPERYAAIGSFSGALDMGAMLEEGRKNEIIKPIFAPVVGEGLPLNETSDLFAMAKKVAALPAGQQPKIFVTCGDSDDTDMQILTQTKRFVNAATKAGLPVTFRTWPGVHEWNFWDRSLAEFIGFVQSSSYGDRKRTDWSADYTTNENF